MEKEHQFAYGVLLPRELRDRFRSPGEKAMTVRFPVICRQTANSILYRRNAGFWCSVSFSGSMNARGAGLQRSPILEYLIGKGFSKPAIR
jgi:hypothetical protein